MKKLLLGFFILFVTFLFFRQEDTKVTPIALDPKRGLDKEAVDISRLPASVNHPKRGKKIAPHLPTSTPMKREETKSYSEDETRVLSRGLRFIKNVYVVLSKNFDPNMGEIVKIQNGMTFFRSEQRPPEVANVAYSEIKGRYYPVSPVLKLANIDETSRQDLIAKGLAEYYYQPELKLMFVQSSHEKLLSLYDNLASESIEVEMEVITGFNQPR